MYNREMNTIIRVLEHQRCWHESLSDEAHQFVHKFFNCRRKGTRIEGWIDDRSTLHHAIIQAEEQSFTATCTCDNSAKGYCRHCHALALSFLASPLSFKAPLETVQHTLENLHDLKIYLKHLSLNILIERLEIDGISQVEISDIIGINHHYLAEIKNGELKKRYFNEIGAIKLACWWMIENIHNRRLKIKADKSLTL